jgi:kinesin family protein 6/9
VHISYLEIYNEVGYDLLDPTREVQAMEDLPQVRAVRAGELQSAF